jgi:hypothetical protein
MISTPSADKSSQHLEKKTLSVTMSPYDIQQTRFILCIYGLFDHVVSTSRYIALNVGMIKEINLNGFEKKLT